MLAAATPGVLVTLVVGGFVWVLAPVTVIIAFVLSGRIMYGRKVIRTTFAAVLAFLGLVGLLSVVTADGLFAQWWDTRRRLGLLRQLGDGPGRTDRRLPRAQAGPTQTRRRHLASRSAGGTVTDPATTSATAGARTLTEALRRLDRRRISPGSSPCARIWPTRCPGDVADLSAQATTSQLGRSGARRTERVAASGRRRPGRAARPGRPCRRWRSCCTPIPRPPRRGRPTCATAPCCGATTRSCTSSEPSATTWGRTPAVWLRRPPRPIPHVEIDIPARRGRRRGDEPSSTDSLWNPAGTVSGADRTVTVEGARTPVEHLLARRLLRPSGSDTVLLPREVAWRLRGGRFSAEPVPSTAPSLSGRLRTPALVDRAAIGAAYGFVHDVELVAHALQTTPHRLLREGGVAVRDVTGLGRVLGTDHAHASFVLECAAAAGLLATGDGGRLLPTVDYDRWAEREPADRWRALAAAWRHTDRLPGLSSEPGAHALGPESEAPGAASVRGLLTELLAGVPVGTTPDLADLQAVLGWHRPRLVRVGGVPLESVVAWTWREAGWLGVSSLGAVSGLARAAFAADTQPTAGRAGRRVPGHGGADRAAGGPDGRRARPGPVPAGPGAPAARRPGVPRWRRRVPLQRPARCDAPSTPAGPPRTCTAGWSTTPPRRRRSRWRT